MHKLHETRLFNLAKQMISLDQQIREAERRGQHDWARLLWEQRVSVQQERSDLMRDGRAPHG